MKTRIKYKDLVKGKLREQEIIFYFHRKSVEEPWYMVLESSLRQQKADKSKEH